MKFKIVIPVVPLVAVAEVARLDFKGMRNFKIPLLVTLIVSLGFGIGLGVKLKRDRAAQLGVVTGSQKLKLLTLQGAFPSAVLRAFAASENVQVDIAEEPTPEAVFRRLLTNNDFDLVTLLTTQISKGLQAGKLQPLHPETVKGFGNVAKDFVDLPGRPSDVVPFAWGILKTDSDSAAGDGSLLAIGDLTIDSPKAFKSADAEGEAPGRLWILNLATASNSKNEHEANSFLSFVLKPETAAALATVTRLSSTNSTTNASTLEARLKPNYLREIPLTKLKLVFDDAMPVAKQTDVRVAPMKDGGDEEDLTPAKSKSKTKPKAKPVVVKREPTPTPIPDDTEKPDAGATDDAGEAAE